MKTNQQFKNEALDALQGNWGKAILLTLLLFITIGIFSGPASYTGAQMQTYCTRHMVFKCIMAILNTWLARKHRFIKEILSN